MRHAVAFVVGLSLIPLQATLPDAISSSAYAAPITVSYTEPNSPSDFVLQISHGAVAAPDHSHTISVTALGLFVDGLFTDLGFSPNWVVQLRIATIDGFGVGTGEQADVLVFHGVEMFHNAGINEPHEGDEAQGASFVGDGSAPHDFFGIQASRILTVVPANQLDAQLTNFAATLPHQHRLGPIPDSGELGESHLDIYSGRITPTVARTEGAMVRHDITAFTAEIRGQHVVSEPATVTMLGLGGAVAFAIGAIRVRRERRRVDQD